MKYLTLLFVFLTSCATITSVEHPIDPEKQKELLRHRSSVLEIDLVNIAILAVIVLVLFTAIWFIAWRKDQNKEDSFSSG